MSRIMASIVTIFAVVMAFPATEILAADTTAPQSPVKLIFIHHSTGGNWLADPNTDQPYGGLGAALMNNNYYVSATNYGWGPDAVGDRTDIPDWPEWFTGPNSATILDALYHENGQNIGEFGVWPRLDTEPGGENEVIMFKSCFPNSDLFGNSDDPPAPSIDDSCTVGNAKAVYNNLLTYFETRQDKLFVVITSPPQNENEYGEDYQTPAQRAANARAFTDWLVNDWLDGYAYSNVAVLDYYNVLTGANNHHRWHNGAVQHVTGTNNNFSAYPSGEWDSHPCTAGQQKATEELVPLLNYFYNCWREGDGGPTPTISPTIDIKVNGSDSEVTIDTSGSVTIGLSLDVGSYAGVDADWWLVHLPPSGVLRSFDLGTMSFEDGLSCVIGTGLFSFPFVPITSLTGLEAGSHILCFGVDTVMNEALDVDGLYYNCSTVAVSPGSPGGGSYQRLQPQDLTYLGAFLLPDDFDWGARGMSYYTPGDGGSGSLLVTGFDLAPAAFAEVSIPVPMVSRNWEDLPEAAMLSEMTDFGGSIVESIDPDTALASGIEYVPRRGSQSTDKLYGSIDQWFGVYDESHQTIWFSEMDGSNPRGPFHVGPWEEPYHGNKTGDFLFSVPQWYADKYLGGRILVSGKTRGAFHGSQGPSLIAFMPWDSESPSGDLDAVPMLWYRILYPECAGPNVGDKDFCDFPNFTMCDKWEGGGFVESNGKAAIILLGMKGLGTNVYGPPPFPGTCLDDQGYHCDPFERQIIFYDVDELGSVAQGFREPWSVMPYATLRPQEFFGQDGRGYTCGQVGGMAVDKQGRRVFMIEKGIGDNNAAVVHVWSASF